MRHRWLFLMTSMILAGAGCYTSDPGDCEPHPIDLTSGAVDGGPSIVLASSCWQAIVVDGVQYINQGEYALLDEAIGRLEVYGTASHANQAWASEFESPEDLTLWKIEGVDPGLGLWGTSATLRGTSRHVLWTIDDCSEVNACEPPICDLVDLSDASAAERCGALQS